MNKVQPIKLKKALAAMHEKDARFSLAFMTMAPNVKDFKQVVLPDAHICKLPRQHAHKKYLMGITPTDMDQHNYTVHTKLITHFNNQPVVP